MVTVGELIKVLLELDLDKRIAVSSEFGDVGLDGLVDLVKEGDGLNLDRDFLSYCPKRVCLLSS